MPIGKIGGASSAFLGAYLALREQGGLKPPLEQTRPLLLPNTLAALICRIVHSHKKNITLLSDVFGVNHTAIRSAILNDYVNPDDKEQDYACAGPEFKTAYPPKVYKALRQGRLENGQPVLKSRQVTRSLSETFELPSIAYIRTDSRELDDVQPRSVSASAAKKRLPVKKRRPSATSRQATRSPTKRSPIKTSQLAQLAHAHTDIRQQHDVPQRAGLSSAVNTRRRCSTFSSDDIPLADRPPVQKRVCHVQTSTPTSCDVPPSTTFIDFLANVQGYDLSSHQHSFEVNGLCTVEDLQKLGVVGERCRVKTLQLIFADIMTPVEIAVLAYALEQ
ncbi:hypothetical protein MSAN_00918200 [Mycena sanguinolenta]|uniref:Uncharacterized protein n=1 Tax=Mycena sanguinolenta TaxID=230812 RepID=A0A8H6YXP2_9AGAR|nr:hypothetical protein MSAN_00918200 [Mycena sanguinolenta]